ncbi:MAG: hypothetical protein JO100_05400 [Pseudonocardia sp.]|nr:hypothetical protein [Pseudonocardia sp.]
MSAHSALRWLTVPITALTVVSIAACGPNNAASSSGGGASPSASSEAPSGRGAFAAYRECLSQHGVQMPDRERQRENASGAPRLSGANRPHHDPGTPPPGVDKNTWDAARAACASLRPTPSAAPTS